MRSLWEEAKSNCIGEDRLGEMLALTGREEPAVDDRLKKYASEGRSFLDCSSLRKQLSADLMTASGWVQILTTRSEEVTKRYGKTSSIPGGAKTTKRTIRRLLNFSKNTTTNFKPLLT